VLASLNHPGIAHMYDVEESGDATALIMELVEGPTLAARIARGPIPLDEALPIARQIARALEAAHTHGVIHRDLKPANVKVKEDGSVKVLDFGLAKAIEPAAGAADVVSSPTITSPAITAGGVILGTAAYMAPEQARGRFVDKRVDVWAFGCVLFEMLSGRRPFDGEDVSEVLAAVLKSEPDWQALPDLPPILLAFLRRCLVKDPEQRLHDVADMRLALDGAFGTASFDDRVQPGAARSRWTTAAAVLAAVVLTALAAWMLRPRVEPLITRFEYRVPADQELRRTYSQMMSSSAHGSFVYSAWDGLHLKGHDQLEARVIPGTAGASNPFFSPDGRTIGYWADGELHRTDAGGATTTVIASVREPSGASWEADGSVLFAQGDGVWRVTATGGSPERILTLGNERAYRPQLLPDGDSVLMSVSDSANWDGARVVVQSISTDRRTVVLANGKAARYLPTGHLVYALDDVLFAAPFDLTSLTTTGPAVSIARGVLWRLGAVHYDVSRDGTLVYLAAREPSRTVTWVDRTGRETPVGLPAGSYVYPRLSPDGTRVALDDRNDDNDIWIWDLGARTRTRLTVGAAGGVYPVWSVDGSRIAYQAGGIWWKAADNTGTPEQLVGTPAQAPYFFTLDGGGLVLRHPDGIWMKTEGLEPASLVDESDGKLRVSELNAALSPDGRWLAYQSDESGQFEIYARPFPNVKDGRIQVSTAGGIMPRWSGDGRELFYVEAAGPLSAGTMMLASVGADAARLSVDARTRLLDWPYRPGVVMRTYDVSPDGQRFLAIKDALSGDDADRRVVIAQNWFSELERLAPSR
jgi:serine/threonine-protein kinase